MGKRLDRRSFLGRLAGLLGAAVAGETLEACSPTGPDAKASTTTSSLTKTSGSSSLSTSGGPRRGLGGESRGAFGLPVAEWVVEENARPGTTDWLLRGVGNHYVEGFLDRVSAVAGDEVT
ncbi:MAG: hypothetical protein ACRD0B_02355, partial [Acidimicrobiales bacterium]